MSGRHCYETDGKTGREIEKYWVRSIPELESTVISESIALEAIQAPASFTPAITTTKSENRYTGNNERSFVAEKLQDVLNKIDSQRINHANKLRDSRALLSKIKSNFYNYTLNIYLQAKFEGVAETLFQRKKRQLMKSFKLCVLTLLKNS